MVQEFVINDQDWAHDLEVGLSEYLSSLMDYYVYKEEEATEIEPEVLSGDPFCGCDTCVTRETLFYVSPKIMRAQNEKKIELNTDA